MPNCQYPKRLQEARPSRMVSIKPNTRLLRIYLSLLPKKNKMISLLLILQIILILRVTLRNFSGCRPRRDHVLAAPDLALGLVLLVVWEEYQGKRLACPLLQRPRRSCSVREAIRGNQEAIKGNQGRSHLLEEELLRQRGNQGQSRAIKGDRTCSRRSCSAAAMARCASRLRLA